MGWLSSFRPGLKNEIGTQLLEKTPLGQKNGKDESDSVLSIKEFFSTTFDTRAIKSDACFFLSALGLRELSSTSVRQ